jgi:hypothetical protein
MPGIATSAVEITNISAHGFRVLLSDRVFFPWRHTVPPWYRSSYRASRWSEPAQPAPGFPRALNAPRPAVSRAVVLRFRAATLLLQGRR